MSHDSKPAEHAHEHAHPTGATYLKVAAILTIITVVEVWAYYIPALVSSPLFNPSLLIMSAAKLRSSCSSTCTSSTTTSSSRRSSRGR